LISIYPVEVDKRTAFARLRKESGITGPTMYLGDSESDNPAFRLAYVSIGIKHRRVMPKLECRYRPEFLELVGFISNVLDSNLGFDEGMV